MRIYKNLHSISICLRGINDFMRENRIFNNGMLLILKDLGHSTSLLRDYYIYRGNSSIWLWKAMLKINKLVQFGMKHFYDFFSLQISPPPPAKHLLSPTSFKLLTRLPKGETFSWKIKCNNFFRGFSYLALVSSIFSNIFTLFVHLSKGGIVWKLSYREFTISSDVWLLFLKRLDTSSLKEAFYQHLLCSFPTAINPLYFLK